MAVIATLVVGKNGSATGNHSSREVTSPQDRARFLERRRQFDCLLIGGNTARTEPYLKTPVPVVIISHSPENFLSANPQAFWWNLNLEEALIRAKEEFGDDILIEAGPAIITEAIEKGLVDQFELSITENLGTGNHFDYERALAQATHISEEQIEDTTFITASYS